MLFLALLIQLCASAPRFLVFIDWDRTLGPYDNSRAFDLFDPNDVTTRHERVPMRQEAKSKIDSVLQRVTELGGQSFVLTAGAVEDLCFGSDINTIHECLIPRDHLLSLHGMYHEDDADFEMQIPILKTKIMMKKAQDCRVDLNDVYFVDDNDMNLSFAARHGIHVTRVNTIEIQESFERMGSEYGDPAGEAFFGHLDKLLNNLLAAYPLSSITSHISTLESSAAGTFRDTMSSSASEVISPISPFSDSLQTDILHSDDVTPSSPNQASIQTEIPPSDTQNTENQDGPTHKTNLSRLARLTRGKYSEDHLNRQHLSEGSLEELGEMNTMQLLRMGRRKSEPEGSVEELGEMDILQLPRMGRRKSDPEGSVKEWGEMNIMQLPRIGRQKSEPVGYEVRMELMHKLPSVSSREEIESPTVFERAVTPALEKPNFSRFGRHKFKSEPP